MRRIIILCSILLLPATQLLAEAPSIIPKPLSVENGSGQFVLQATTQIEFPSEWRDQAELFITQLKQTCGLQIQSAPKGQIRLLKDETIVAREGYHIEVSSQEILLKASTSAGIFCATQSLLQLIPLQPPYTVPAIKVRDAPQFPWRGIMLDSSRHFQSVAEIKRFIDIMAHYKLNVFHWHITDGHGWRIEIKKYPKLTEVGAWRQQPGYPKEGETGKYGGFYTQEEIRDVVRFAATRNITVVPEIDMPGHCAAAISAYPELGCSGKPQPVDWFFDYPCREQKFPPFPGTNELCVGREHTINFMKDVLDEVISLFPSEYIHIGGDEVNYSHWKQCKDCQACMTKNQLKDEHALQSWFIKEISHHLLSKKRKMLGWDEILHGGLAPSATVMSWTGEQGGITAAKMGHDVVMTPHNYVYLDHGQSNSSLEPNHWPGHNPLDKVYHYNPIPNGLSTDEAKHILGLQGNVWTVFTHESWLVDIQTWPRACAIAEVGWSSPENRKWEDFQKRLRVHRKLLDKLGVNYWWEESKELGQWTSSNVKTEFSTVTYDVSKQLNGRPAGKLPVSFQYAQGAHGLAIRSVKLYSNGEPVGADTHDGFTGWTSQNNSYHLDYPAIPENAKVELKVEIRSDGGTDSVGRIVSDIIETRVLRSSR